VNTTGFLLDVDRCTGCHACTLACSTENELGWGRSWRHVVDSNPQRLPQVPSFHLSLACNHCDDAPCEAACPALAIGRAAATGATLIDPDRCLGCRYCSWACPFDAPRFDAEAQVMGKCTLCSHREGETPRPACAEACPTDALRYGPLVGDTQAPGFPRTSYHPKIRFDRNRRAQTLPECSWQLPEELRAAYAQQAETPRITLKSEWPLLVFSLLALGLVSWVGLAARSVVDFHPGLFAMLCLAAMGSSTLHLGQKRRAWRAVLNLRRSWLSREIAGFGSFVGLALASAILGRSLWPAAAVGLVALFCIDRVYDVVRTAGARPVHSADLLLGGAMALAWPEPGVFAVLWAVKIGLYLRRRGSEDPRLGASAGLRMGVGFALPLLLAAWHPAHWIAPAVGALSVGEILDRVEFYRGLRVITPRATASAQLRAALRGSEAILAAGRE
jgi:Fe-S-cluster-containing dehydrogenase component